MAVYRLEIPVPNYECTGIVETSVFFECDSAPTQKQVLSYFKDRLTTEYAVMNTDDHPDKQYYRPEDEIAELYRMKNACNQQFPRLSTGMLSTNTHVDIANPATLKIESHPLTISILNPIKL